MTITTIHDLQILAERRVPRMFYDYADSGSWTEQTYDDNEDDFELIRLRQKVAINMENRSTKSTMVGQEVAMPVACAPTGLTGMQHADGEILAAKACEAFGVPFTLVDHVDLLHRGCGREHQQALLVSALHDEGSRFHVAAHPTGQGCRLRGARAHA
jgi:hypothetical protein